MPDDDPYWNEIALPLESGWGLSCTLKAVDDWHDAFEISCREQYILITVCLDYYDKPYWLLESSNLRVAERIVSIWESGSFPTWFLEWNGIDLVVSNTTGQTYIYCLDFSSLVYLIAYLFGENRIGIRSRASFPYLFKKTKTLITGRKFQRTLFGSGPQPSLPLYSRVACIFVLWRENIMRE